MVSTWVLDLLTVPPTRAAIWLALSFMLAGSATLVTRLVAPDLEQLVRIVRWVQVPYFGLILGGLSPRLMGLTVVGWDPRYTFGLVLLAGLLVLLVLIRIRLHTETDPIDAIEITGRSWSPSLMESCAQEFHWCFLRGAVWELLYYIAPASLSPHYWAVWIGAAISLTGIFFHPASLSDRLLTALVLMATSSLFLVTQSFWLCCFLHLGIRVILLWNQPIQQRAT
ncbi:MAG: hypothetical protein OXK78_03020 [Caldilineaceae bacterium]|nr:hypothetical protein [Caldilineaceae bacterium]